MHMNAPNCPLLIEQFGIKYMVQSTSADYTHIHTAVIALIPSHSIHFWMAFYRFAHQVTLFITMALYFIHPIMCTETTHRNYISGDRLFLFSRSLSLSFSLSIISILLEFFSAIVYIMRFFWCYTNKWRHHRRQPRQFLLKKRPTCTKLDNKKMRKKLQ